MGKNKIRSKDKARKDKTSISDTNGSSTPSTWTSDHGAVITRSTSNTSGSRQLPTEPPGKTLCVPTIASLKDTTTSSPSSGSSPAPPITRAKRAEDKRDSVISSTWEGPKQLSGPKATTAARPRWGFKPRNWWPCRTIQWIYRFCVALTRIRWTDKQTSKDLILTLAFIGIVVAGGYVALDVLLNAIPGVSAQAVDGNCSIVYVTVPGPIITISLVGASPTNPAKGTYYFSVVNSTTEWLDSIAPPSRFRRWLHRVSTQSYYRTDSFCRHIVKHLHEPDEQYRQFCNTAVNESHTITIYIFSPVAKQLRFIYSSHQLRQLLRRAIDRFHFVALFDLLNREFHFDTGDVTDFSSIIRSKQYTQPYIVVELFESAFD
ncbi:uncharacterized protein J4E79_010783 [Alternaria viburni]|uniref:uncharacterized protein n=1 Tax=Alternaria viburni TaxID=566460 RepID=UPI0020C2C96E|nr:uncharacterized protein J4E79_010783 [Alternaria viburni]KAI4645605.1 hypothetical protein J4E79_010783 [Alternaria viburni]